MIPSVKAVRILGANISALLRERHLSQHDLAFYCHHSDVWISYFLTGKRGIKLKDLDRIADFFGMATYELFLPGLTYERRLGIERRAKQDRRIGHSHRILRQTAAEIDTHRPQRKGAHVVVASSSPLMEALNRASAEHAKRIDAILSRFAESGGQAPTTRAPVTTPRKSRRAAGGSDAPQD